MEIKLQVEKHRLENGLKLLLYQDRSVPTTSFMTYVSAGARDETKEGTTGLAHVLEHMMFRGTYTYPEYDKALAPFGPESNASTGRDFTRYFVNVKREFLEDVIRIESDRFQNLTFTNDIFRTELGPVKEERRKGYVDNPDGFLYTKVYEIAYRVHTYHHPVIGWEEDLEKNMQYTNALEFFRTYYSPNNCCIIIAGNFDREEAFELVGKHYSGWKKQNPPDTKIPSEPEQTEERAQSFIWKDSLITPRIAIAYHGPNLSIEAPDYAALLLVSRILFMQSQRIRKKLYTDLQFVESIDGGPDSSKDPGLFLIYANLKKGKSVDEVRDIVLSEIDKLLDEGIGDKEFQKAKNSILASTFYSLDRPYSVANTLGFYETVGGDFQLLFELNEKVKAMTKKKAEAVANNIFRKERQTVATLVPKSN
ncbi:MAG: pitrilysin family protein [Acidobacteriota bacterium]